MSEDDAERMRRTMQVAAWTLDAADVERLETDNEQMRAILRDLTACDPSDPDLGDCMLCGEYSRHGPDCPYLRAVRFLSEDRL